MTRTSGEVVRSPRQTEQGDAGTAHESGLPRGSHGRSAPYAASRRSESVRPARLLAPARLPEYRCVFHEQVVKRLAQVSGLWHPCQIRQLSKLGDRISGVVTRHLCLITFRF
jgi:hypothetical protein